MTMIRNKNIYHTFSSLLFVVAIASATTTAEAQTKVFDLTRQQPEYNDSTGYGYDINNKSRQPGEGFYFSVKVPDGNYRVTVSLGSRKHRAVTCVRAESRRLMVENCMTRKKEQKVFTFVVNKRSPYISEKMRVKLKPREHDYLNWDDRLTLEFSGENPAVASIKIDPADDVRTVYLCGNSTVVDQENEPYASWGQMITRWFGQQVAISNHAESGLTAGSFLAGNRLEKILTTLKKGDYVVCEFGHNDQKEKTAGAGAWFNFQYNLKIFIDKVREKGGKIIFCTPTQRRAWDKEQKNIVETHADYPDAMRDVARRENVPVIEIHDMTRTFFETLGYEDSKKSLVHYPAGTWPGQEKDLADNTHFNPYGAYEVAKMVVMGMKELQLEGLAENIIPEWKDYDPAQPDAPSTFKWYPATKRDAAKPDGN